MASFLNLGSSYRPWNHFEPSSDEIDQIIQAAGNRNGGIIDVPFLKLQEANNILRAAYKEFLAKAMRAKTWVLTVPALGNIDEILPIFQTSAPTGMKVECTIEEAVLPVQPATMVALMMDESKWAQLMDHFVYKASGHLPTGVLQCLRDADINIQRMRMIDAEIRLPTPFTQTRKFKFLRCQREIIPKVWAVFDVSIEYFEKRDPHLELEGMCLRRPSGMIIRERESLSEVIWIENVLVYEQTYHNMFSNIINLNLGFCAKSWIRTSLWKLKRGKSYFRVVSQQPEQIIKNSFLILAGSMKRAYMSYVTEAPDQRSWVTLWNAGVRVMMTVTANVFGLYNGIGVTSYHVHAKPHVVFDSLVNKNVDKMWENSEQVVNFATEDYSNFITLHQEASAHNSAELCVYLHMLKEASKDEFCSFVIWSPIIALPANVGSWGELPFTPSGFAIIPDGSDGLQSNASLVTIVKVLSFPVADTRRIVKTTSNVTVAMVRQALQAFDVKLMEPEAMIVD